ncbi:hypothetical protein QBC41DRAFT_261546 [Cercophora samala]|uniref:Rhodopsin domain-containing protein n=1 Tax=Cercophora samala TaxID=330535 RepID=A0AA39YY85_9PEZI|nr:hypothetical protein QBC41DRAFT_261546 [Cercophora samala]
MIRGSQSFSMLGWIISFIIICSIFVLLRFWSSTIQKRKFYADDFLVLLAHIAMIAMAGVTIWGIVNGLGNPAADLSMDEFKVMAQVLVGASVTWTVSTTVVKMAVLCLYTRIFDVVIFKRIAYGLIGVCACYGIAFEVVFITRCTPVSQEWDPVPWGSCKDVKQTQMASNSINLVLDVAIVVLPMIPLWSLQMALTRKLVITGMFGFGFATVAVMLYRVYVTVHANPDPALALADVGLLSFIELWLGIIVACVPTTAPVFRTYVKPTLFKALSKFCGYSRKTVSNPIETIGGSGKASGGRSGHNFRSNRDYAELSIASTFDNRRSSDISLVPPSGAKTRTYCGPGGGVADPTLEGVYVQQQFHVQELGNNNRIR